MTCTMPQCQSTAGCKCNDWWLPRQVPTITTGGTAPRSLAEFSDAEIVAEYHRRALAILGDQRVGVGP